MVRNAYHTDGPQRVQGTPDGAYYLLQHLLYRRVALADTGGNIAEAYDNDAYGNTLIFTAAVTNGTTLNLPPEPFRWWGLCLTQ